MNTKLRWLGYLVSSTNIAIILLGNFRQISSQDLSAIFPYTMLQ